VGAGAGLVSWPIAHDAWVAPVEQLLDAPQALDRTAPMLPMQPGLPERRTHVNRRLKRPLPTLRLDQNRRRNTHQNQP
jgi:hypothetical protein